MAPVFEKTLVMILSGGRGERLYPLTKDRAKPSVPFLGSFRIIDFSLSNCLNSGLRKIALLTQYKSLSLERHLQFGWNIFHPESRGYVISLPAQGRVGDRWYEGTADADRGDFSGGDYAPALLGPVLRLTRKGRVRAGRGDVPVLRRRPIETLSQSEKGYDIIHQGFGILPCWTVTLAGKEEFRARLILTDRGGA